MGALTCACNASGRVLDSSHQTPYFKKNNKEYTSGTFWLELIKVLFYLDVS